MLLMGRGPVGGEDHSHTPRTLNTLSAMLVMTDTILFHPELVSHWCRQHIGEILYRAKGKEDKTGLALNVLIAH